MKRDMMVAIVLTLAMGVTASQGEWKMEVHEGETTTEFVLSDVDSINFYTEVCLQAGAYTSAPAPSYTCGDGILNFSVAQWIFDDLGGGAISVTPFPGPLPVMTGTMDCIGGTFTVTAFLPGSCDEEYSLSGQILSETSWSGTFTATYTGSGCLDCVQQNWEIDGDRASEGCLVEGYYVSTPPFSYNCAFELVDFSVSGWVLADLGDGAISVAPVPGPLPVLTGTMDCNGGTFEASALVGGGCIEEYLLIGTILSTDSWSGTFTSSYSGTCWDCTFQSWDIDGILGP